MFEKPVDTANRQHQPLPFLIKMPSTIIKRQRKRLGRLHKRLRCAKLCKLGIAALPTIVFGVFTVIFTIQQDASARAMRQQDQRQADEINRRTMFKDYIDDIRTLLLDEDFEDKVEKSLLHIRVQTLTVLKNLDASRKHDVILFLYENRLLLHGTPPTVDLRGANLNGMKFVKSSTEACRLHRLYLPGVYAENIVFDDCIIDAGVFDDASMVGTKFHSCNLMGSSFRNANLSGAELHGNHLYMTNFSGANLARSSIRGGLLLSADLSDVDLYQSDISHEILYPLVVGGLGTNIFLNTRHPNGSFININTSDLIIDGQAQSKVCISESLLCSILFRSRFSSAI